MIKNILFYWILTMVIGIASCPNEEINQFVKVVSPNKKISITFDNLNSKPTYSVQYNGTDLITKSSMGFEFKGMKSLDSNFTIIGYDISNVNENWEQPWGEQKIIHDNHCRLFLKLKEKNDGGRKLNIEFKVFNDGIGFRYIVPKQKELDSINITNELTEFSFTANHTSWSIPAYHHMKYEILYNENPINQLDTAHTPLTLKTTDGLYVSIHEAALVDYSSMTLYGDKNNKLYCDLVPWKDGIKVKRKGSFMTPWRTIQIAENPGGLIESSLILNLNEPNKLGDVSWVKPMKYVGIWWGMHIGNYTFYQGPNVGATTERTKKYIDFAAKHGFDEVLVEGWNFGWTPDWGGNFAPEMDFTKPAASFDWEEVLDYANSKNIYLQVYNETAANTENYLAQIDSAYALYQKLGYRSAKVGQVHHNFKNGEWHHGQYGVNYYQTVVDKGAKHKIAINFHEPIKPTGLRRTYPNLISREGARGQEFNAWDSEGGNPPEHTCILPFTRLLAGPMDFTPGVFSVDIPQRDNNQVNTTLTKQLALYVVLYSPIQMAADLIENYEERLDAFQFIKDVPVDWETTKVIDAKIADFIIIARKDKYSEDWYLGAITDEKSRNFIIKLDFLNEDFNYEAQIYKEVEGANYKINPTQYVIQNIVISGKDSLSINLPEGGGTAIRFKMIK